MKANDTGEIVPVDVHRHHADRGLQHYMYGRQKSHPDLFRWNTNESDVMDENNFRESDI
jgi:hypothetical protein